MSQKNNVNPDHYKVAGRDRPNEVVPPEHASKNKNLESENAKPPKKRRTAPPNFIPGAAPVGESPERDAEE
jgi:hypothetical protein